MAQSCRDYKKWVEEKVEKQVDDWVEKQEEKCKKRKWYDPRGWFCWIVTTFVRVVRWVVITVGKWVTYVVCEIVTFTLNFFATFIWLILSIPILGRLIAWIWRIVLTLVWGIVSAIVDGLPGLFGIRLRKKVRVCIVILTDETGPLAQAADFDAGIERAKKVYDREANVEFIVAGIHTYKSVAPDSALDVHCESEEEGWGNSATDDLLLTGTFFENVGNTQCFDGAFLRLIGYASPLIVFVVRDIQGDERGCSLGPLTDYVTIEGRRKQTPEGTAAEPVGRSLGHEVGHACHLRHKFENGNLMCPGGCAGDDPVLTGGQVFLFRASRHVTFL